MRTLIILLGALAACGGDDGGGSTNPAEVITTVQVGFIPTGGGLPAMATFEDLDGDGGNPPTIDPLNLVNGATYSLTIRFVNKLETPPKEITTEVNAESDAHQVFLTGTAVKGPATTNATAPLTHTYDDMDVNGAPVGLQNMIIAATGTGMFTVTLRHMPSVNGNRVKTGTLADTVKASGIAALPGDTDASVTFMTTVQ